MKLIEFRRLHPAMQLPPPDPTKPRKWHRFDCPLCHGKKRNTAAVNYHADWFVCYRCTPDNYSPIDDNWAVRTFWPQIENQVVRVKAKFGAWVSRDELWGQAKELVWQYSEGKQGNKNDAGMLWDWEAACRGDYAKLRAYVGKALNGDLMTYADSMVRKRRKKGDALDGAVYGGNLELVTDSHAGLYWPESPEKSTAYIATSRGIAPDWEYWRLAQSDRVKFASWGLRMCEAVRNGLGPWKDHCEWCNAALTPKREVSLDEWLKTRIIQLPSDSELTAFLSVTKTTRKRSSKRATSRATS